jgi:hypothetical protein
MGRVSTGVNVGWLFTDSERWQVENRRDESEEVEIEREAIESHML